MKKVIPVLAVAVTCCIGGVNGYSTEYGRDFVLPAVVFSETLEDIRSQSVSPAKVDDIMPAEAAPRELVIVGTVNGYRQTCRISDNKMSCSLSDNRENFASEINGLTLARAVYLDRMLSAWIQTNNIREACPSAMQHVCTGGKIYDCKHTKVTTTEMVSRPCNTSEIDSGRCPSNGMVWEEKQIDKCYVSCTATSASCSR